MQTMAREFPGFAVFAGSDPLMLPLLEAGGAGCITATANLIANDLATVLHGHRSGSNGPDAEKAQKRITQIRRIIGGFPQIPAIKALIARRYADPGWRRVRPPLVELTEMQRDDLFAQIDGVSV
jgi:4-hydroxy-tetrahydrodipicolinate synthase